MAYKPPKPPKQSKPPKLGKPIVVASYLRKTPSGKTIGVKMHFGHAKPKTR